MCAPVTNRRSLKRLSTASESTSKRFCVVGEGLGGNRAKWESVAPQMVNPKLYVVLGRFLWTSVEQSVQRSGVPPRSHLSSINSQGFHDSEVFPSRI